MAGFYAKSDSASVDGFEEGGEKYAQQCHGGLGQDAIIEQPNRLLPSNRICVMPWLSHRSRKCKTNALPSIFFFSKSG